MSTGPALADDAPNLELYQALAFTDVNHEGDAIILMRYELDDDPLTGWTPYLSDASEDTSLEQGKAFINLYSNDLINIEYQQHPPRIGHGLAGVYIPSDAPDFDAGGIDVCIESDTITFTNPTQACIGLDGSLGHRSSFAEQLVQTVLDLQMAKSLPVGAYVNSDGYITQSGRQYAVEAFSIAPQVAYDVFQASSSNLDITVNINPTPGINSTLDAGGADVIADLNVIGAGYFGGASGTTLFLVMLLLLATVLGGAAYYFTDGNTSIAGLLFAFPMLWGIWFQAPTFALYATILFLVLGGGVIFLIRKASSG